MIRIVSSLIAFFSITSLYAQNVSEEPPKLVIGITIDQLRGDYLKMFQQTFGEKGFKRLLNEGLVYSDINYDFPHPDLASAVTTVYTGTYPFYHGIVGEKKYAKDTNQEVSSFFDRKSKGVYTTEQVSPTSIKVSTLTDELKIASVGKSDVYAFAPNASAALASGGHAANGAYWIDDYNGKWASSSFYKSQYTLVDQHNRSNQSLSAKIGTYTWRPAIDILNYKAFPYTQNVYNFQHYFGKDKINQFKLFKQSPFVNTEVRKMAEKLLNTGTIGKHSYPDFLALTFYAGNFENATDKNYSLEIQDTYYRLDQEIALLLETVEKTVGLDNTLIFVVPTGYCNEQEIYPDELTLAGGKFYPERTRAMLNMYLMAIYGNAQWITKYYDEQLFFDRKQLDDKKINAIDFQKCAAEFLVQFAGVQDVITSHQMLHGAYNQTVRFYRNGYHKDISGDLFVELQPGWQIVTDDQSPDNNQKIRNSAVSAPVIFFGNNIKPQKIYRTIEATEIAPSVAYRLRIRAPNAAQESILKELF